MRNRLMNDLDLCLKVVSRYRQPLRYIWRWIWEALETEAWFQRTTNRKWYTGYRMVTWPMTSRDLERSNSCPRYAKSAISRKLLELQSSNLLCSFVSGMPSRRRNNFLWKWAWQSYITKSLFITVKLVVAAASVPGPSTDVFLSSLSSA